MKVLSIDLDPEVELPTTITVKMTIREALFVAILTGQLNSPASEEIMRGGSVAGSELYNALTGLVFNKYFDDGVNDAKRELL